MGHTVDRSVFFLACARAESLNIEVVCCHDSDERQINMAENSDEKAKEPSISDLKQNIDDEYSTAGKTLEKETKDAAVLKTQDDFRLVGRNYIENIKASLLASSANFNRAKYAATLEDPYMKAYRYLEEHKVLALFEVC